METKVTLLDIEECVNELQNKKSEVVAKKQETEMKLSNINNSIRGRGMLPAHQYKFLCDQQDQLKRAKNAFDQEIQLLNIEIRKKNSLKDRLKMEQGTQVSGSVVTQLTHLKNHYINFAADGSRVASMRKMAAEFAEKLEDIITEL